MKFHSNYHVEYETVDKVDNVVTSMTPTIFKGNK